MFFSSCASYNYSSSDRRSNNTFTLVANTPQVTISYKARSLRKKSQEFYGLNWNNNGNGMYSADITFNKLKRRGRYLIIQSPNYVSDTIKIKRAIRFKEVLEANNNPGSTDGSILYWLFSPVVIPFDFLMPSFYKISKKSKTSTVNLKYTQEYMDIKFQEIKNADNPITFESYMKEYPYSKRVIDARLKRDSLHLNTAIGTYTEEAISKFISTHEKSKFLDEAIKIKEEMVVARNEFQIAKNKNTKEAYEDYLKKFPKSIQKKDATNNLVDVVFKKILKSNDINEVNDFNIQYLVVNFNILNFDTFQRKSTVIANHLDDLIVSKYDATNKVNYESYSKIWKAYREVTKFKNLYRLKKCESYLSKISDMILFDMAKLNNQESQNRYLNKAKNDFNEFVLFDEVNDTNVSLILSAVSNSINFNGKLILYNQGYFSNRIKHSGEGDWSRNFLAFNYREKEYSNFNEINVEEFVFTKGLISDLKLLRDKTILMSYSNYLNLKSEYSYYLSGKLVRTDFREKNNSYFYEFENGINLTLKNLEDKIKVADYELANKNFDYAIELYNNCYKNDYPKTIALNLRIEKSIQNAGMQKIVYQNKLEQQRVAEEKKQEKIRLAEEKKQELIRIAEEKSKPKIGSRYKGGIIYKIYEDGSGGKLFFGVSRGTFQDIEDYLKNEYRSGIQCYMADDYDLQLLLQMGLIGPDAGDGTWNHLWYMGNRRVISYLKPVSYTAKDILNLPSDGNERLAEIVKYGSVGNRFEGEKYFAIIGYFKL